MTLSASARTVFNQAATAIQHAIDVLAGRDSED
jgi:hypothetical protein